MGDHFQIIADLDATVDSAALTTDRVREWMIGQGIIKAEKTDCVYSRLGHAPGENYLLVTKETDPLTLRLRTNGVGFIAERSVFHSWDPTLVCSACGDRSLSEDAWSAAVEDWYVRNGVGMLACPQCDFKASITEWKHEPPWAYGNAGIEFWNWPILSEEFINEVAQLTGHRVRLVHGKF